MIENAGAEPRNEVPEADWADQQAVADPAADDSPTVPVSHPSTTEADTADIADQDQEVVLDEED